MSPSVITITAISSYDILRERFHRVKRQPQKQESTGAIDVATVPHPEHQDEELTPIERVDHTIPAHMKPAEPLPLGSQKLARQRLVNEGLHGGNHAALGLTGKRRELFERPPLPPNRDRGHA
jgi:hypothetical protein